MNVSIWWFAFGYFACYVPYTALTKAITGGLFTSLPKLQGAMTLPMSVFASVIVMIIYLSVMKWWGYLPKKKLGGLTIRFPDTLQFFSGICAGVVVMTTTLAYTFTGVSIVFMMLLQKGGALIIAPIVDLIMGRRPKWYSWCGFLLSLCAIAVPVLFVPVNKADPLGGITLTKNFDMNMPLGAWLTVFFYLLAYFVRFLFMTKRAKTTDADVTKSYFVQEQVVATPVLFIGLAVLAALGSSSNITDTAANNLEIFDMLNYGFTQVPQIGLLLLVVLLIGTFSGGTGICGNLIYLSPGDNTFCVPVNRCSSVLAGVVATFILWLGFDGSTPKTADLIGAAFLVCTILLLSFGPRIDKARQAKKAAAAEGAQNA